MKNFLRSIMSRGENFVKRHEPTIGLMAVGALLTGIGVLSALVLSRSDHQGIEIIKDETVVGTLSEPETKLSLVVDVAGAVERPGVYRLDRDARLADALAAAGGLSSRADRSWLAKSANLAQKITDGSKIYIPAQGETGEKIPSLNQSVNVIGTTSTGVNLNTASAEQLDALWGIGERRAQDIIDGRPYSRVEELIERKIIPQNVYERNQDKLKL